MIPFDTKNYRARTETSSAGWWCVIGIVGLVMLLAWMGGRDREAHVKRVNDAAIAQCEARS